MLCECGHRDGLYSVWGIQPSPVCEEAERGEVRSREQDATKNTPKYTKTTTKAKN